MSVIEIFEAAIKFLGAVLSQLLGQTGYCKLQVIATSQFCASRTACGCGAGMESPVWRPCRGWSLPLSALRAHTHDDELVSKRARTSALKDEGSGG